MNPLPHHPRHSEAAAAEQFQLNLLELVAQANRERDLALECASQLYARCWHLAKTAEDFAIIQKIETQLAPLLRDYYRRAGL